MDDITHFMTSTSLAKEILLLSLPSPAFSPVAHSWGLESYILIIVYLSSDCKVFSDKAQGLTYILGPLTPTKNIYIYIYYQFGLGPLVDLFITFRGPK